MLKIERCYTKEDADEFAKKLKSLGISFECDFVKDYIDEYSDEMEWVYKFYY